ncbi:MAG: nickel transport protein, partial [Candidatus Hydrogenedentes bacterium]|nr:nickel transport protein [Candidatus Hydrogenedentota bacterium]
MSPGLLSLGSACLTGITLAPAAAHFQEIIPTLDVLPEGGPVTLDFVFTHPVEGGPVMEMKKPVRAGVLGASGAIDLLPHIKEKEVSGQAAWTVTHDLPEPG